MTVKELKEKLNEFPDDMEVICTRYSDYQDVKLDEIDKIQLIKAKIVSGVRQPFWIMRTPEQFNREQEWSKTMDYYKYTILELEEPKEYLHFVGN